MSTFQVNAKKLEKKQQKSVDKRPGVWYYT